MVKITTKTFLLSGILAGLLAITQNGFGMEQEQKAHQLDFYIFALKCPFDTGDAVYKITDLNSAPTPYYISDDISHENFTRTIINNSAPINIQEDKYKLSQNELSKLAFYQKKGRKIFVHKPTDNKQCISLIQEISEK